MFTDDKRKILAVGDLKKEEVRRGRSEHARSDDCHGFEYAAAYKLKSAVHAEILTLLNASGRLTPSRRLIETCIGMLALKRGAGCQDGVEFGTGHGDMFREPACD